MKTDYLYFTDDHGFISNILDFADDTNTSDNFIRIEALSFLVSRRKMPGEIGIEGYFSVSSICQYLGVMGYTPEDTIRELNWCDKRGLLISDTNNDRDLVETDVVKAHASAFVHTNLLLHRVEYLANCALTMKVFNQADANRYAEIWGNLGPDNDITLERKREIIRRLKSYFDDLKATRARLFPLSNGVGRAPELISEAIERALSFNPQPSLPLAPNKMHKRK